MKKLILTLAVVGAVQFGFAQEKASREDALKAIEASGTGNVLSGYKDQIVQQVAEEKRAAFTVEFDAMMVKINEKTADIFVQEYTKEDIKAMLDFYNSPVGKKMKEKAGAISAKSQETMMEVQGDMQALMMKYMQ
jgi:hypothetical protein